MLPGRMGSHPFSEHFCLYSAHPILVFLDFLGGSDGRVSAYNVGDSGSIPGSGRSPGEGNATHSSTLA